MDAEVEIFDKIQQFRARTGTDKGTAGIARRFHEPRMPAAETTPKHAIVARRFGSTGSSHGIPPNLEGIMTQKTEIGNGLIL
jgi:hypothetical protein